MTAESYRDKIFEVSDPDARLRKPDALDEFVAAGGGFAKIAKGTKIRVDEVRVVPAGARRVALFVHATPAEGGAALGWTSANNLDGRFLSETIGQIPPAAGASRFGPNAAWANGNFLGQVTLVQVVGTDKEIERIAESTCSAFLDMVAAARKDGILIGLNSGFRSFPEQKHLHDGFTRRLPGFNPANRPGTSNHQNGIAFDIDVGGGGSNPVYLWLQKNATSFGFVRTVRREAWHWENLPDKAAAAKKRGVCSTFE